MLLALLAALAGTSTSAFAAGPKPDPPPIKHAPPPPPASVPPPPAYVPPPPAAVTPAPPSGPTRAQILAAERAAARAKAERQAKVQRLQRQRRAARLAAALREAKANALQLAKASRPRLGHSVLRPSLSEATTGGTSDGRPVHEMAPVVMVAALGALIVIGLSLFPSPGEPRFGMFAVIGEFHDQLMLGGLAILLSIGIALAVTLLAN